MTDSQKAYMRVGRLQKTSTGRWSIGENYEVTSGEHIEVNIADHWIRTRIESSNGEYYAVVPGIRLQEGMEARQ